MHDAIEVDRTVNIEGGEIGVEISSANHMLYLQKQIRLAVDGQEMKAEVTPE